MKSLCSAIFLLTLGLGASAQQPAPGSRGSTYFRLVQWTDIHAGGKSYSETAFNQAAQQGLELHPQGIVLNGDFCDNSHDPDQFYSRLRESLHKVANRIGKDSAAFFLAVGNDDLPHNHQTAPADIQQTVNCFREAFGDRCYLDDLGNGVSPNHLGDLKWISLNSVIFNPKNTDPQAPNEANRTLNWLRQQMPAGPEGEGAEKATAPGVVLVVHIPPAWDLYDQQPSWKMEYLARFQQIVSHYPGQVFVLAGHYHRNHVQAMERPERDPVVMLTAGALAIKYGYHSNWRDLTFHENAAGHVTRIAYNVHYTENNGWNASYQVSPSRMGEFFDTVMSNEALYRRYVADIYGHATNFLEQAASGKFKDALKDEFWVHAEAPETVTP